VAGALRAALLDEEARHGRSAARRTPRPGEDARRRVRLFPASPRGGVAAQRPGWCGV